MSINRTIPSIKQVQNEHFRINKINKQSTSVENSFDTIFRQTLNNNSNVVFSKHANMRLQSRNIKLTNEQIKKIEQGVLKAEEKGIKESLVLIDKVALVVNVKNKTVITALDQNESKDHVFTNIDGAVVI